MIRAPLILDPHAVPVIATDAHLPGVSSAAMTPAALRERFARPPEWAAEFLGDSLAPADSLSPAAVLVPLVMRPQGLHLLLTQRTAHLRAHAGQVSFPGGRSEAEDADATATALREALEEIGLQTRHVEVIGVLPIYTTVTAFAVTPVVALIEPPFDLTLDIREVATTFEVPLEFIMTPANHRHHSVEFQGRQRRFLSMPWTETSVEGAAREHLIWGATAAMLRNLYRLLRA